MTTGSAIGRLGGRATRRLDRLSDRSFAAVTILPALVLVAIVVAPPILAVAVMSLFRINLLRDPTSMPFVGLTNFLRIPSDAQFLQAVPLTILFAAATTIVVMPVAIATAVLLNGRFRGLAFVSVAVLLPWAVAPVVTGLFWKFIFNGQYGLMTGVLNASGLASGPVVWLDDPIKALVVAVMATAWRSIPLPALIILATLRSIPDALFRAAKMDGATGWQTFRFVTWPAIRRSVAIMTILTVIIGLQTFDVIYSLTGGGPGRATTVMSYYIYESVVLQLNFGYSSVLAISLLAVIVTASAVILALQTGRRQTVVAVSDDELTGSLPRASPSVSGPGLGFTAYEVDAPPKWRFRLRLPMPIQRILRGVGIGLLLFWLLAPIVWIAIASLQREGGITSRPPQLDLVPQIGNYVRLLTDPIWHQSILVSLQVAGFVTFIAIVIGSLAAYPLARFDIPGRGLLLAILIFTQMVPGVVLVIPVLLGVLEIRTLMHIDLKDTVFILVVVNVAFWLPLIIWLLRNVFDEVPRSLEWAARVDGCSRIGALFRVILPASAPGIAAVAILLLIGTWNEFLFAAVLGDRRAVTVTNQISNFDSQNGPLGYPPLTLIATAGIVAILPCVLLVVVFWRRVLGGLTGGFMKG
jgi:ABC-type sugar transport system permease subunit